VADEFVKLHDQFQQGEQMLVDLGRQQTRAAQEVASATTTLRSAQDSLRGATAAARIPEDLTVRGFHQVLRGTYIRAGIGFHGLMTAREGVLHGNPSHIALGAGSTPDILYADPARSAEEGLQPGEG